MMISILRSIILYVCLIAAIRLMGKRQIGQMEPSEFVVAMLLADLAATPVQDPAAPLLGGILPILTIMAVEQLLSMLSYCFIGLRKILCGNPVLLMDHGKIIYENLKKTRLTPEELMQHLRERDIFDLSIVQYAILETNGQISAMIDSRYKPPTADQRNIKVNKQGLAIPLISNGKFTSQKSMADKPISKKLIHEELKKNHCKLENVILFTRDEFNNIYLSQKEE